MENIHQKAPKIIYILGTGHSGSTLLELILSTAPETFSVGGFRYLDRYIAGTYGVICDDQNQTALASPLWHHFARSPEKYILQSPVEPVLSRENRRSILFTGNPIKIPHRYHNQELYTDLQKYASEITGKPVTYIIDSSKTLARFIEINNRTECEVYVIHLMRDVRGVVNSNRKLGKPIFRSVQYWMTDNIYASRYLEKNVPKAKTFKLHYEDLVANPEQVIGEIGTWLNININFEKLIENINNQTSYRFAGNQMRQNDFTGIRLDTSWRKQLPWYLRFLLSPLNFLVKRWVT